MSSVGDFPNFEITDAKLHVHIVTSSTKNSVNLAKQLSERFKRSVYWNNYQTKPAIVIEEGTKICQLLNASFQGVRILFVPAYVVAVGIKDNKK